MKTLNLDWNQPISETVRQNIIRETNIVTELFNKDLSSESLNSTEARSFIMRGFVARMCEIFGYKNISQEMIGEMLKTIYLFNKMSGDLYVAQQPHTHAPGLSVGKK